MTTATFETPDGDDIKIDGDEVVQLTVGQEDETTVIELDNGDEVTVVATQLEVAAALGLNPLEFVDQDDDDESLERLVDEEEDYDADR